MLSGFTVVIDHGMGTVREVFYKMKYGDGMTFGESRFEEIV